MLSLLVSNLLVLKMRLKNINIPIPCDSTSRKCLWEIIKEAFKDLLTKMFMAVLFMIKFADNSTNSGNN